jgi:hypothetical protein
MGSLSRSLRSGIRASMTDQRKPFTPADFVRKLEGGGYSYATAARRALSKMASFSTLQKEIISALIELYFPPRLHLPGGVISAKSPGISMPSSELSTSEKSKL